MDHPIGRLMAHCMERPVDHPMGFPSITYGTSHGAVPLGILFIPWDLHGISYRPNGMSHWTPFGASHWMVYRISDGISHGINLMSHGVILWDIWDTPWNCHECPWDKQRTFKSNGMPIKLWDVPSGSRSHGTSYGTSHGNQKSHVVCPMGTKLLWDVPWPVPWEHVIYTGRPREIKPMYISTILSKLGPSRKH